MFEGVQLSIEKKHRLGLVLVSVGEGVEALCEVEAENDQGKRADELFLEGDLGQLRSLHST